MRVTRTQKPSLFQKIIQVSFSESGHPDLKKGGRGEGRRQEGAGGRSYSDKATINKANFYS